MFSFNAKKVQVHTIDIFYELKKTTRTFFCYLIIHFCQRLNSKYILKKLYIGCIFDIIKLL